MEEMSVLDLQEKLASGELTALGLLESYLERIEQIDRHGPALNAVIELNPDAPGIAEALDQERKAGRIRGPLHGIPILIKDNIDTHDRMQRAVLPRAMPSSSSACARPAPSSWARPT
jgi:amidase